MTDRDHVILAMTDDEWEQRHPEAHAAIYSMFARIAATERLLDSMERVLGPPPTSAP